MAGRLSSAAAEIAVEPPQSRFSARGRAKVAGARSAHRIGIDDYRDGFDAMLSGQAGKVVMDWTT